jgi:acetyl esterase/lipase
MSDLAARVHIEVLTLPSDPPGEVREAPGGGRVLTFAALFTPKAGENVHGVAVVLLCDGPGSHPLSAGEPTRFAAERLAAMGYTVLSVYSHLERGFPLFPFHETAFEIDAALTALEARGYEDFVLGGHGYGAIAALNYVASHADPVIDQEGRKRVQALALFSPLTELEHYPGLAFQGGYDAHMAKAQASFASGRGGVPAGNTVGVAQGPGADRDPWIATGDYVQPAELTLDYWGPQAAARNRALLEGIATPTLILAGDADPACDVGKLRALAAAKAGTPVELIVYPGGDRAFAGLHDRASEDLAGWLAGRELGLRRRVRVTLSDATAANGRRLPGVIYRPDGEVDPERPAFLMIHGRSGDILFSSTHWMSWRLAQAGYACLAGSMRISGTAGIQTATTEETAEDIGAWMDTYAALGFKRIVLLGHSNGGVWISDYLASSQDKRAIGVVYIAPTAIWRTHAEQMADPAYAETFADAKAAVERGELRTKVMGLQTLNLWWDYNRPDTRNLHTERVKQFDLPALSILGTGDALFTDGKFMEAFREAYRGPLEEIEYEGGTHGLRENKHRIVPDVDGWMKRTFGIQ